MKNLKVLDQIIEMTSTITDELQKKYSELICKLTI
jgi:hypothetical protein